ncbi:MAG: LPS export ABC transporter periplasmic protein LptC [Bacteroidales bacterium]
MKVSYKEKNNKIQPVSITVTLLVTVMLLFVSGCTKKDEGGVDPVNTSLVPTMKTKDVESLISDSGITRYKFITKEWLVYSKAQSPYWHFPKGIYVEKFDSLFHVEASIEADSAYFWEQKKLWELKGNVRVKNIQDEKFETQLLFWDQNLQRIYSDSTIRIEQPERIIIGKGFESNEQMTRYTIRETNGIFSVREEETASDSTSQQQPNVAK